MTNTPYPEEPIRCCADSEGLIEEVVTKTMTEPTLGGYKEEVQADYGSNTNTPRFNKNAKFKLGDEFLKILRDNAFNGTNGDDVINHTAKVLAIMELIKIPNVDPNQLRMHVFPLSLTGATRKWWIDEVDGKITTWGGLMEKFFHKYYPLSHTCKNTLISDYMDDSPNYLVFINWLNSKFGNHRRMGGKTKNALWEFWIKGGDYEVLMDDIVSSDNEREESSNTNHPNDNADSFFKPYLDLQEENNTCTIKKGPDEHRPKAHDCDVDKSDDIPVYNNASYLFNEEDEPLNEGVYKSENFEVIRYSLGPSEECIAINTCEYDAWKRTEGIVSSVYHEIFCKKDQGWLVKRTKWRAEDKSNLKTLL
ncbi:hypothetical protein Tco_0787414 [Tanacetum coccineum]